MTTREAKADELVGREVSDSGGQRLGRLEQVYRDRDSDAPTWGVVNAGRFREQRFVPLSGVDVDGDEVVVPASKAEVDESPRFVPREAMSPEVEQRLRRHYGGGSADAGSNGGGEREGAPRSPEVARERQRDEYGGFSIGAAFFGWLVAAGLASILTGIVSAAGAAIGLTKGAEGAKDSADAVGIVGAALLLAVLLLAYYAGGYVAGRLSRFDGGRQGLAVWLFGLAVTLVLAAAGVLLGAEYNVLQRLDLPRIPVDEGALTVGGLITLAAVVLGTLLAAVSGGKVGERFHRKVDRVAYRG
jgi:sporulation protein YlmC with PRC-barrel domain